LHLTTEAIIDLIEGRSNTPHAKECAECARRLDEWHQLHSRLRKSRLEAAPETLLNAAYDILVPSPKVGRKIGRILASMIFDSFTQPAFAGARGAAAARQMVLRAAEFDVHVRISGKADSRQITGQVLSRGERGFTHAASVYLLHGGTRIRSGMLDAMGEFEFEDAPEGLLSLQIDLPTVTVIGELGKDEVV
jgi:hypothetical protein